MLSHFLATTSLFHFVIAPVTYMRQSPEESAEVVSQAYFSEEINVIEEMSDWMKIETTIDHYQGWVEAEDICAIKDKSLVTVKVNRCMAHLYQMPDIIYGPMLTLPFESLLGVIEEIDERWIKVTLPDQREGYIQRGDVAFNNNYISQDELPSFSLRFQGLPYTWAGRSSFGYDCSGFVQMLYRQMGIHLPRDSKDQAKWEGFKTISIDDLSPGDLIFFGLDETRIRHVGMYLGDDKFIHSTVSENAPYIHISGLSAPEWNGSGKWPYKTARALKEKLIRPL